jgi:hypothetical protein
MGGNLNRRHVEIFLNRLDITLKRNKKSLPTCLKCRWSWDSKQVVIVTRRRIQNPPTYPT